MSLDFLNSTNLIITPPSLFQLYYTLKCGQIFGWRDFDGGVLGMIEGQPIFIRQKKRNLTVCAAHVPNLSRFFRWDDPLLEIASGWKSDPVLELAFREFAGLRLIRQDPWNCLAGFILSIFSSISKIEMTIDRLASYAKTTVRFLNASIPAIPPPHTLASMRESALRDMGMGFRAPYLRACAKAITDGFPLIKLKSLPYPEARKALMELPGIGEKVADCILLFSLEHLEAFPVDVWMQRILQKHYFNGKSKTTRYLSEWGREKFGPRAGYAQQYLYTLGRKSRPF